MNSKISPKSKMKIWFQSSNPALDHIEHSTKIN